MKNKIISNVLMFLGGVLLLGCKAVVNKFAFFPDTESVLSEDQLPGTVKEVFIETDDRIKIQCYFIPHMHSGRVLIYFHGNGGNIGQRIPDLLRLHESGLNVLGVGYRGYGKSQGRPSEKGIYLDGKAALEYATGALGFSLSNVILFGRSIGTTVAVHTGQQLNIAGLVLISPLTSGAAHAKAGGYGPLSSLAGNAFDNLNKVANITCPILVLHGTRDEVIPFNMGKEIYDKADGEKTFAAIEGAGHNDLSTSYEKEYWPPIFAFIKELKPDAETSGRQDNTPGQDEAKNSFKLEAYCFYELDDKYSHDADSLKLNDWINKKTASIARHAVVGNLFGHQGGGPHGSEWNPATDLYLAIALKDGGDAPQPAVTLNKKPYLSPRMSEHVMDEQGLVVFWLPIKQNDWEGLLREIAPDDLEPLFGKETLDAIKDEGFQPFSYLNIGEILEVEIQSGPNKQKKYFHAAYGE